MKGIHGGVTEPLRPRGWVPATLMAAYVPAADGVLAWCSPRHPPGGPGEPGAPELTLVSEGPGTGNRGWRAPTSPSP